MQKSFSVIKEAAAIADVNNVFLYDERPLSP